MSRSVPASSIALTLALFTLPSCSNDPAGLAPPPEKPAFTATVNTAGGLTFAEGSGCTLVLSHFECGFTVEGAGTAVYAVTQRALWSFSYQCIHKKNFKVSRQGEQLGFATATILQTVTASNDQVVVTGTVLSPTAPTPCAENKGAFTRTQLLSGFTPSQWSILVQRNDAPDNYFASMFEVL